MFSVATSITLAAKSKTVLRAGWIGMLKLVLLVYMGQRSHVVLRGEYSNVLHKIRTNAGLRNVNGYYPFALAFSSHYRWLERGIAMKALGHIRFGSVPVRRNKWLITWIWIQFSKNGCNLSNTNDFVWMRGHLMDNCYIFIKLYFIIKLLIFFFFLSICTRKFLLKLSD